MYVHVDIDPDDILGELTDKQLERFGLQRLPTGPASETTGGPMTRDISWASLGAAVRRRDFDRATELLFAIADRSGHSLPPFVLGSAA